MALALLCGIVVLEWASRLDYSLGIFYVLPVIIAATVLARAQVVAVAVLCAGIRGSFQFDLPSVEYWLRFGMAVLAYSGAGLLVAQMSNHRRIVLSAFAKLKVEQTLRQRAQHQLHMLAESSPAAMVTLNPRGQVLSANRAAHELLGLRSPNDVLTGHAIDAYVPMFAQALNASVGHRQVRNVASTWAKRADGTRFPISTWFSTYDDGEGRCLAGIFVDVSEEMRDRELEAFRHFSDHNRLMAGAVSHEIRNLCSAIRVVTSNLDRRLELAQDADFTALKKLVGSLVEIASIEVRVSKQGAPGWSKLDNVLEQLRLVIEPDWAEIGGCVVWRLEAGETHVQGEEHGLLQVFLNLTQNALRAAQHSPNPTLEIHTKPAVHGVVVSVIDSGPGVRDPSSLFHPFGRDATGAGLGLYVSRMLARTFGGDITCKPNNGGGHFDVTLLGWRGDA